MYLFIPLMVKNFSYLYRIRISILGKTYNYKQNKETKTILFREKYENSDFTNQFLIKLLARRKQDQKEM